MAYISALNHDITQGSSTNDYEPLLIYSYNDLRQKKTNLESTIQGQYETVLEKYIDIEVACNNQKYLSLQFSRNIKKPNFSTSRARWPEIGKYCINYPYWGVNSVIIATNLQSIYSYIVRYRHRL